LVDLVEDCKVLEKYSRNRKLGFYQTISNGKTIEIRVNSFCDMGLGLDINFVGFHWKTSEKSITTAQSSFG